MKLYIHTYQGILDDGLEGFQKLVWFGLFIGFGVAITSPI